MTRIALVVITTAALNLWPTSGSAQAALNALSHRRSSPGQWIANLPLARSLSHPRSVVGFHVDERALRAVAGPAPWRPHLSTDAIAELPARISWNQSHTALAGVFVVGLLIDAAQTRALARNGWSSYREGNPLLGERPSVGRINTYTALAGLSVLGAAAALPPRVRPWLLGGAIAVQALTVARSVRMGLPISFP
jgi:hypothetical protein